MYEYKDYDDERPLSITIIGAIINVRGTNKNMDIYYEIW
jgi:hypothetical protein